MSQTLQWMTKNGPINVSDMSDAYLINLRNFLYRQVENLEGDKEQLIYQIYPIYKTLQEEFKHRGLIISKNQTTKSIDSLNEKGKITVIKNGLIDSFKEFVGL